MRHLLSTHSDLRRYVNLKIYFGSTKKNAYDIQMYTNYFTNVTKKKYLKYILSLK